MKRLLLLVLMLSASFALAQESQAPENSNHDKGDITVRGCVSRAGGDYTLIKQNPAMTYELQGNRDIHLRHYLGQRVEITGHESPSMSTSSDASNRMGSASPVTITVRSIKTIDKECPERGAQ